MLAGEGGGGSGVACPSGFSSFCEYFLPKVRGVSSGPFLRSATVIISVVIIIIVILIVVVVVIIIIAVVVTLIVIVIVMRCYRMRPRSVSFFVFLDIAEYQDSTLLIG